MSIYRVTGPRQYRGHRPGECFEAVLEPPAERRAIRRGAIVLVKRITPDLVPGSWKIPAGWLT